MTLPLHILIKRHFQSQANLARDAAREGDNSLLERLRNVDPAVLEITDPVGVNQGIRTRQWLKSAFPAFGLKLRSSMVRTVQSADLLELPGEWITTDDLRERSWGRLDNLSGEERMRLYPKSLEDRDVDPYFWEPPGGETLAHDVSKRVNRIYTLLRNPAHHDLPAIIVTHCDTGWYLRCKFEGMDFQEFRRQHLSREPGDHFGNGHIVHYTRVNPETGEVQDMIGWVRVIRPTEDPVQITPWRAVPQFPIYRDDGRF